MTDVTQLESGYDFITLYFKSSSEMLQASKRLYSYLSRTDFEHTKLQRKNFMHQPGDVPHFHNGIDATKGPHIHIIYPERPTENDWEELRGMLARRLVNINIPENTSNEVIS